MIEGNIYRGVHGEWPGLDDLPTKQYIKYLSMKLLLG